MRPTRNWTTYVPESDRNTLRKKCIELSPTFPLSSSTPNTVNTVSRSSQNFRNNNNNNPIKDQRNGMKSNFLCKSNDSVNKTGDHFDGYGDNIDAVIAFASATTVTGVTKIQSNDPTNALKSTVFDTDLEK